LRSLPTRRSSDLSSRNWALGAALGAAAAFGWRQMPPFQQEGESLETRSVVGTSKAVDADLLPATPSAPPLDTPSQALSLPPPAQAAEHELPPHEADPLFSVPAQHLEPCQTLAGEMKVQGS